MGNLPDDLKELFDEIDQSIYEDDEDYKEFAAKLKETIENRARFVKKMKYSSPTKQRFQRIQLVDLDNKIEQIKRKMKEYRESYQTERREEEKEALREKQLDELFEQTDLHLAKMYIIAKHQMPKDFFEGLHASIVDNLPPELVQEFYERVAQLEATQLEDILAGK